jgi:hypothetical protein
VKAVLHNRRQNHPQLTLAPKRLLYIILFLTRTPSKRCCSVQTFVSEREIGARAVLSDHDGSIIT